MDLRRTSLLISGELATAAGRQTAGLLAAWTALWRPELVAHTGQAPQVRNGLNLPPAEEIHHELLLTPAGLDDHYIYEWLAEVRLGLGIDVVALEGFALRTEIVPELFHATGIAPAVADDLAAEFYAVGFALLQVERLCHHLQSSGGVNRDAFDAAAVKAAQLAVAGEHAASRAQLQTCHDLLATARNQAYGVSLWIVNVLLFTSALAGDSMRTALGRGPINLLIDGAGLDHVAAEHPETASALRAAIASETLSLLTSGYASTNLAALSPEDLADELQKARHTAERVTGRAPSCYGSFAGDFPQRGPQWLSANGVSGALLTSFTGGDPTSGIRGKALWASPAGAEVQALAKSPLDAGQNATFLDWSQHLARALEHESPATLLLASWPGHADPHYEDLVLAVQHSDALGKFVSLEKFFADTPPSYTACEVNSVPTLPPGENSAFAAALRWRDRLLIDAGTSLTNSHASNVWSFPAQPLVKTVSGPRLLRPAPGCGVLRVAEEHYATPATAQGERLTNGFVEAAIDPQRGTLRSLRLLSTRQPALSQRMALRCPVLQLGVGRNTTPRYEEREPICQRWEQTPDAWGGAALCCSGDIGPGATPLGKFTQTVSLVPGRPWAVIDVAWELAAPLAGDPAHCYLAYRLAWRDAGARLSVGRQALTQPTTSATFAPGDFVQWGDTSPEITLIPWGATRHRRLAGNQLDTPLESPDPQRGTQRFALLLGETYPLQAYLELSALMIGEPAPLIAAGKEVEEAWRLHLGARNLVISRLAGSWSDPPQTLRLRIVETEGRLATGQLQALRPIRSAMRFDLAGQPYCDLPVNAGIVDLEAGPYDWFEVALSW